MAKNDNNIWYPFLKSFISFLSSVKYPIVDTGYDCIIVDVKDGDLDDPNTLTIRENKQGLYFVKEDNSIYNELKELQDTLIQGQTFTSKSVTYFIASDNNYYEFRENKRDNTILGDLGISLKFGQFDVKKDETEVTNEHRSNLPAIIIQMDEEIGINALEQKSTDGTKAFNFAMSIMCLEEDINNNITGYDVFFEHELLVTELINDYFESRQCKADNVFSGRSIQWLYDMLIYNEYIRPVSAGVLLNTISYR